MIAGSSGARIGDSLVRGSPFSGGPRAPFVGPIPGGLCKVKSGAAKGWRIIIDKRATADERVQTIATAVAGFDTSELEIPQKARDLLRLYEGTGPRRAA